MYGLDLFSGIGGITLALKDYVRPIAYCEKELYCQAVLLQRMAEGKLPRAPIWDDVKTLRGSDLPKIDIIYGGFPCQDISVAGKQKGLGSERSGLFFEIARLTEEIQPSFVFLENVPAIRTNGLEIVCREFTRIWYDCRWTNISAAEVGSPHVRKRWFLLAHAERNESGIEPRWSSRSSGESQADYLDSSWWVSEPELGRINNELSSELDRIKIEVKNAKTSKECYGKILQALRMSACAKTIHEQTRGLQSICAEKALLSLVWKLKNNCRISWEFLACKDSHKEVMRDLWGKIQTDSSSLRRESREQFLEEHSDFMQQLSFLVASQGKTPWDNPLWESGTPRIIDSCYFRVDRVKALGNAVVPLQVRSAFEKLIGNEV